MNLLSIFRFTKKAQSPAPDANLNAAVMAKLAHESLPMNIDPQARDFADKFSSFLRDLDEAIYLRPLTPTHTRFSGLTSLIETSTGCNLEIARGEASRSSKYVYNKLQGKVTVENLLAAGSRHPDAAERETYVLDLNRQQVLTYRREPYWRLGRSA